MFDKKKTTYEKLMEKVQEIRYNDKINVILNLHNRDMDILFISDIVNLPTTEIEHIINEHMQSTL